MGGFKPDKNDLIIAVMGPTGAGKTEFINALTGNAEKAKAAHLASATQHITPYTITYQNLRLVLVDTPGFDDTRRSDMEILQIIADWLIKKYPDGETLRIAGIVYLHRITDNRMSGSAFKNLKVFCQLCGNIPLRRVRLVTTMWDIAERRPGHAVAVERERELTRDFWWPLIVEGAVIKRSDNKPESARQIVDELIQIEAWRIGFAKMDIPKDDLLLQEELVEQKKRLNETEAGKVLYSANQKLLAQQKETLKELTEEAKLQNDPALARSLQEEYDKINAELQNTFAKMEALKIPLTRRIILWLFSGKSRGKTVKLD